MTKIVQLHATTANLASYSEESFKMALLADDMHFSQLSFNNLDMPDWMKCEHSTGVSTSLVKVLDFSNYLHYRTSEEQRSNTNPMSSEEEWGVLYLYHYIELEYTF